MTTKDQERKALEQIKKIVVSLGVESYIGKAFEGCFELAEENIDDDFWNSYKEKAELNRIEAEKWIDRSTAAEEKLAAKEKELKEANDRIEKLLKTCSEANGNNQKFYERQVELMNKVAELEDKQTAMELENMKLKAKLYDLMTA